MSEENRTLNRLVKRQGVVLDRISSNQGELPTLLYAHNEEVRVMRQRMKQAQDISRQLEEKLKFRDAEIFRLKDLSKKQELSSVGSSRKQSRASSNYNLEMEDLKDMVAEKEHEISVSLIYSRVRNLLYSKETIYPINKRLMVWISYDPGWHFTLFYI